MFVCCPFVSEPGRDTVVFLLLVLQPAKVLVFHEKNYFFKSHHCPLSQSNMGNKQAS